MPSHPTLFDDDNPPADPDADAPSSPDPSAGRPNYLARRAAAVAAAVAVIALLAIVVGRLIGGGGDGGAGGGADADWDEIVVVDERSGDIVVLDRNGEQQAEYDSLRSPNDVAVVGQTAVVVSDSVTAVIDLDDGATDERELGAEQVIVPTGTTRSMVAATADGTRAVLVHGPTGDVIDTDDVTRVSGAVYDFGRSLSSPSGRDVLVTDTGNFQTVLFSFDEDEPAYFPGLALAIDDDTVVTAQNVGADATISVFDHAGDLRSTGRTPAVRAALAAGETVRLVTVDGSLLSMSASSGATSDESDLEIGAVETGTVLPTGEWMVVRGAEGTRIVGSDGDPAGSFPSLFPFPDADALRGSTCITLAGDLADGPALVVADATSGRTGTSLPVEPDRTSQSAEGCTVAVAAGEDGFEVITMDDVTAGEGQLVAIAPDAAATVAVVDQRLVLVAADTDATSDDDTEVIDLGPSTGRAVHFT